MNISIGLEGDEEEWEIYDLLTYQIENQGYGWLVESFDFDTESFNAETFEAECITCAEPMGAIPKWSCECCGFLVGTQGDHEGCGANMDGTVVCNHCYREGHEVTTMVGGNEVIFNSTCKGWDNEKHFGDREYEIIDEYVLGAESFGADWNDWKRFNEEHYPYSKRKIAELWNQYKISGECVGEDCICKRSGEEFGAESFSADYDGRDLVNNDYIDIDLNVNGQFAYRQYTHIPKNGDEGRVFYCISQFEIPIEEFLKRNKKYIKTTRIKEEDYEEIEVDTEWRPKGSVYAEAESSLVRQAKGIDTLAEPFEDIGIPLPYARLGVIAAGITALAFGVNKLRK